MSDERSGSCERKVRTLLCIGISRRENYLLSFNADVSFTIGHAKERPQANTGDTAATSVVFSACVRKPEFMVDCGLLRLLEVLSFRSVSINLHVCSLVFREALQVLLLKVNKF